MKVLTIDFDIIMAPSIEFYNDKIKTDGPVKDLEEMFNFVKNLPADMYIYQYLTQAILESKEKEIIIIKDHGEIVPYLKKFTSPIEEVINIDHHHDLGYEIDMHKPLKNYDCGNWAKYLLDNKIIQNYTWIYDDNSSDLPEYDGPIRMKLRHTNLNTLIKKIDYIVLCKSLEWVPVEYWPLFGIWEDIVENFKKI